MEKLSVKDIEFLAGKGISAENVEEQIEQIRNGLPKIILIEPCSFGNGIKRISEEDEDKYYNYFLNGREENRYIKFVPASGAASRMFKNILNVFNDEEEYIKATTQFIDDDGHDEFRKFLAYINYFAFYEDLELGMADNGKDIGAVLKKGDYKKIVEYVLTKKGLNLSNRPKALIKFHNYENHPRTAFEEHLVEGKEYSIDSMNIVKIHFTVSREHLEEFKTFSNEILPTYESKSVKYDISFSVQDESTNTVSLDEKGELVRGVNGEIFLRQAGHGALLSNLEMLNADIVFIKNIDNVVPDSHKGDTYNYKKLLAGYLIEKQKQIFRYLSKLENDKVDSDFINQAIDFVKEELLFKFPAEFDSLSNDEKLNKLTNILNRPIRVCGMVKNQGEPGGGPFLCRNKDKSASIQIVEKDQVDLNNTEQKEILNSSAYFNPVDLVCGLRNYKGEQFKLADFINTESGMIAKKSHKGREIKTLELPGLWNGSMADWNTIFVEVPITTFAPVKEINDLLRPEHQPK